MSTKAITPKSELDKRLNFLRQKLIERDLDGALIVQNSDLFYFAGTIQQSHLYLPKDDDPILLVRKSLRRAKAESSITNIYPLKTPKALPNLFKKNGLKLPATLGMELDVLPTNLFFGYQNIFPQAKISDISHEIRMIRSQKSEYEIERIQASAHLADQVAAKIPEYLTPGISEIELAAKIESCARVLGHQGIIRMRLFGMELFYGHIMAGSTAAIESYLASPTGGAALTPAVAQGSSQRPIMPHEPILVDIAFAYQGYIADHTRIYALDDLPQDLLSAHQSMLDIQKTLVNEIKSGVICADIYTLACDLAQSKGYGNYFMGAGKNAVRFVGHGIGVELDEYPFLAYGQKQRLTTNMVIALEPKLIFPGKGVVGIENSFRVTPDGLERLTHFPDQIHIVPIR
jgi:Xaa-Pro dipeptidase